jgi:flagellar basal-body rod modification protein FlgD
MAIGPTAATAAQPSQLSGVGIQDFLKILSSQLNNQDPLKPVDNEQFIAQIAQFTALEQTQELNQKIDGLLSLQSASQSIGLLGKSVSINSSGSTVSGTVTALDFSSGTPQMSVTATDGSVITGVTLSQIVTVR